MCLCIVTGTDNKVEVKVIESCCCALHVEKCLLCTDVYMPTVKLHVL